MSPAITDDDNRLLLFLAMYPHEPPHLVVTDAGTDTVAVPQHLLRGFLLSVATLVGRLSRSPETAPGFEESLIAAYRGRKLAVMSRAEARCSR